MTPTFSGRIVEWDKEKRCGWVDSEGQRIFLHSREFSERRKRAAVGDSVSFTAGTGPTGELCARNVVHLNDGGSFGLIAGAVLLALLLLPSVAAARIPVSHAMAALYALLVNLVTYALYASDKKRARTKSWRVAEATLHFW